MAENSVTFLQIKMTEKLPASLLRPSQIDTADFIIKNPACAVFSDMGSGKTASVITAVEKLFAQRKINKLLIVTTLKVSQETWPNELKNWQHASYLKFVNIAGNAEQRIKKAITNAHIYIINQELFVWLAEKAGKRWPFDMVVFDDVSGFKSGVRKSKTSNCKHNDDCPIFRQGAPFGCHFGENCKAYKEGPRRYTRFGATVALRPMIKRLVHLTGTPTGKGLLDLWPLMFALDNGKRLERTITNYKRKHFNQSHDGYNWELKSGHDKIIHNKIKDICIAIPTEAKLLPCYHIKHKIKLPKSVEKVYTDFAREFILAFDNREIEAANKGVLAGKLLQVCGGAVYDEEKEWIEIHDEKIKAVKTIVKKHPNEPILIGYNYRHELERLQEAFPQGVDIKKIKNVETVWNAGQIPMLFAHPASAGHGLNLQKGPGRVLIWFGLNHSLSLNKQFNKRLHRPGQKRDVYIYYIIASGMADSDVMEGVAFKDYTQQQLLKAIRKNTEEFLFKSASNLTRKN